jgi:thymidine kinase
MLRLYLGPMFAGKTEGLISAARECGNRAIMVKPKLDDRWGADGEVKTHSGITAPAHVLERVSEVLGLRLGHSFNTVCIDEGQFFPDLAAGVAELLALGLVVHVSALSGTFEQKPWQSVSEVIPLADEIVFLRADCDKCREKQCAKYTWRISPSKELILVGAEDEYMAVCQTCLIDLKTKLPNIQ